MQSGSERELKVAPRWFEVNEVADGVFRITEPYVHAYVRSNSWLVRGRDSHLLVDSGLGIGRLPDELADYLDRPVIAVATHAHFDHFGGLADFADRAAHRDDGAVIEQASDYVTLTASTYPVALLDEFDAAGEPVPELLIDALPYDGFDLIGIPDAGRQHHPLAGRWRGGVPRRPLLRGVARAGSLAGQHLPLGGRVGDADLRRRNCRW